MALGLCMSAATAPALAQATHTPPAGYKPCAIEGQKCSFTGTASVIYGAGTTWTHPRSFANGVSCGNQTFGDPVGECRRRVLSAHQHQPRCPVRC